MAKVTLGTTMSADGLINDRTAMPPGLVWLMSCTSTSCQYYWAVVCDYLKAKKEQIRLERLNVIELPSGRTHLRFFILS